MSKGKPAVTEVGRLALRKEGLMWNAYFAPLHTMEGAILLGSIRLSAVAGNPPLQRQFMTTMQEAMNHAFMEALRQKPEWKDPKPAPEHERGGRA